MKIANNLKQSVIEDISLNLENALSFTLLHYHGLNVQEMTNLRRDLKKNNAVLKVYKNTLLKIVLSNHKINEFDEELKGPNAIVFNYNEDLECLKIINKYCKNNDNLQFNGGYFNKSKLSKKDIKILAIIPDRSSLIGMLAMSLKMPLIKLACTLQAIKK